MTTEPQSNLWVILNAAAQLLATEEDPERRLLLYQITEAVKHIEEDLRERK